MSRLALHHGNGYLRAEQAAADKMSALSLSKLFSRLAERGLLESRRGPGGGFALARPASDIRVADILDAVQEAPGGKRRCLLKHRRCGTDETCPIHETAVRLERELTARLGTMTLTELAGI